MPQMIDKEDKLETIIKQNKIIIKQNETIIKQNETIKKQGNYTELKLNVLMKETYSIDPNAVKWNDAKQEQVPKTVLEVWESLGKNDKENGNVQY